MIFGGALHRNGICCLNKERTGAVNKRRQDGRAARRPQVCGGWPGSTTDTLRTSYGYPTEYIPILTGVPLEHHVESAFAVRSRYQHLSGFLAMTQTSHKSQPTGASVPLSFLSAQKRRPVTDAKEVGVGNPAGRNVLSPDYSVLLTRKHWPQPVRWHSFTLFCRCGRARQAGG